jgi:hypothetical protein
LTSYPNSEPEREWITIRKGNGTFLLYNIPNSEILTVYWSVKAAGLAPANKGEFMPELYRLATVNLPVEDRKVAQWRIKEALLKGAVLYGIPRSGQALGPLFQALPPDEIGLYAPRWVGRHSTRGLILIQRPNNISRMQAMNTEGESERRVKRGRKYFETLWTPGPA